jgi:hypothetical protein
MYDDKDEDDSLQYKSLHTREYSRGKGFPVHNMKTHAGMDIRLQTFLTAALDLDQLYVPAALSP